jgi:hypothetical protein
MDFAIPRLLAAFALVACTDEPAPVVCLTDVPEPKGELVLEASGWGGVVPLYQDGDEFMMIHADHEPGIVRAWGIGRLTALGEQRLADALAQVDPSMTEPGDCPHVSDPTSEVLHYEGQTIEFLGHCPPLGFAALVAFHHDIRGALGVCPLADYSAEYGEEQDILISIDCESIYSLSQPHPLADSEACL